MELEPVVRVYRMSVEDIDLTVEQIRRKWEVKSETKEVQSLNSSTDLDTSVSLYISDNEYENLEGDDQEMPSLIMSEGEEDEDEELDQGEEISPKKELTSSFELSISKEKLSCSICAKDFVTAKGLRLHRISSHGGEDPIHLMIKFIGTLDVKCPFCEIRFEFFEGLKNHVFNCHKTAREREEQDAQVSPTICPSCSLECGDTKQFLDHFFKKHQPENLLGCGKCEHRDKTPSEMVLHLRKCHGFDKSMCRFCGLYVQRLEQHEVRHRPDQAPYQCGECAKKFHLRSELNTHVRNFHSEEVFMCDLCGSVFTTRGKLSHHNKLKHQLQEFFCSFCKEPFKTDEERMEHQLETHQRKPRRKEQRESSEVVLSKKIRCRICSAGPNHFKSFRDFQIHLFKWHVPIGKGSGNEEGGTKCPLCEHRPGNRRDFLTHYFKEHSEDCELCCSNCEFRSSDFDLLERHMVGMHWGIKRMCEICGQRVFQLAVHKKERHSELASRFQCDVCGLGINSRGKFLIHMEGHKDERNYRCKYCNTGFNYKRGLLVHEKKCEELENGKEEASSTSDSSEDDEPLILLMQKTRSDISCQLNVEGS